LRDIEMEGLNVFQPFEFHPDDLLLGGAVHFRYVECGFPHLFYMPLPGS
jgi:hypothetical protein